MYAVNLVKPWMTLKPAEVNLVALTHLAIVLMLSLQIHGKRIVKLTHFQKCVAKHAKNLRLVADVQTHLETATIGLTLMVVEGMAPQLRSMVNQFLNNAVNLAIDHVCLIIADDNESFNHYQYIKANDPSEIII